MPNVTIYLPDDLAAKVREHQLPVSKVCQAALARKVRFAERDDPRADAARSYAKARRLMRSTPAPPAA